ncbi:MULTISPECIES: Cdc6/Cdc18 family protein [Natrinema]|uniref:ORC1-type DNA replication protein n=1 Tax=Natrinema gari JCM 14663 TaxID=1230459 RepID=L9YWA4_9EURY|nr:MULTISPECIES: orc1/cdc6 family replication initiation protein [Natrinema]AFO55373.1 orc1/cdc6 family replication initiation protein [Natrinema sp. J7-2]ELY78409.1 orc1/cdc6 family replication initiation protein [Natrinema gari JCM 14663]
MEDGTDGENGSLEDFWATEDPIFSRKELLDIDLVPNEDRIIGRDSEIKNVASSIHPAVKGQSPRNTLIYGKTGTGKSLVAKHVTRSAQQYSVENGTELGRAYVDCTQTKTETRVVINLAQTLNDPEETGISIPVTGLSTDVYYERFWSILDHCYDVAIIILDEIDKLQDSEILMQLSRAGEAGKLDSCNVGIIAISNKISFKESLDERILSSLQDREFVFPPYDANQLREIMSNREDAFRDGVLSDDVIPLSAAFAAQEHGDARKALDILRNAGELAKDGDAEEVTEEHVRNARERADIDRFSQLLEGQPTQIKASVYALSLLAEQHSDREEFATREIYETYQTITSDSALGIETLSQRRMSDKLDEQVFLDILGRTERVGRGYSSGVTNYYYLLEDPSVVQAVIHDDNRFSELDRT